LYSLQRAGPCARGRSVCPRVLRRG
jgi:hypothetical protein